VLLIEDDPYRDLRYEGSHIPPIKSFDRAGNVIFLTSTSKILCPGLRVGAAYLPGPLMPYMSVAKQAADMHSATLTQAIVSEFIGRGLLGPHIEKVCKANAAKLGIMREAIKGCFPRSIEASEPLGGLFVWCTCPGGVDAGALLEAAIKEKVAFIPGEQFFAGGDGKNTFRLNFSNAKTGDIARGIEVLGRVLSENE